jgi:hypothetical protein
VTSPSSARNGVDGGGRGRSGHLVIAFSLLGNGLVRHKFGRSLALVNHKQTRRGVRAVDECNDHCRALDKDGNDNSNDNGAFNMLFVANPLQSWYQKDDNSRFGGYVQYKSRICAALQLYSQISLVGDSMGSRAALLFFHLATNAVLAFSPQVDLERDALHVSQSDMTPGIWRKFCNMLYRGVRLTLNVGMAVIVHQGSRNPMFNILTPLRIVFRAAAQRKGRSAMEEGSLGCPICKEPICKECWYNKNK